MIIRQGLLLPTAGGGGNKIGIVRMKVSCMNKEQAIKAILDKGSVFTDVSDCIWEYAETALEEYQSAEKLIVVLEDEGFAVERSIAGIPTAFMGIFGHGSPVIGLLGEFDALSGLSQQAGVARKNPVTIGGNGHGCGHNCLGAGSIAAAVAVKEYLKNNPDQQGTVIYCGCPGEEGGSGKAFMARAGAFKRLDAAITWHPYGTNNVFSGSTLANYRVKYHFEGIAAHAAAVPHMGRSALDAAELMNTGVQYLREHIPTTVRIHYAFTDVGGYSPNVVQSSAELLYLIRASQADQLQDVFERVNNVARGAALMTDTKLSIEIVTAVSNIIPNETLEKVLQNNFESTSFPAYTEKERDFAKQIVASYEMGEDASDCAAKLSPVWKEMLDKRYAECGADINDYVLPFQHFETVFAASTDVGDVSWICPTAQIFAQTAAAKIPEHSWQYVACNKTSIAHKGLLLAGQVMAGAVIDLMIHPELLEQAKAEHQKRLNGKSYQCLLPDDVQPSLKKQANDNVELSK